MLQIKFSLYSDAKICLSLVVLMLWEGKYVSADKKKQPVVADGNPTAEVLTLHQQFVVIVSTNFTWKSSQDLHERHPMVSCFTKSRDEKSDHKQ